MEVLLNSDIAKLVLGYLKEENLDDAYYIFCQTSKYLTNEFEAVQQGYKPVQLTIGNLVKLVKEFCELKSLIDYHYDILNNSHNTETELKKKFIYILNNSNSKTNISCRKRKYNLSENDEEEEEVCKFKNKKHLMTRTNPYAFTMLNTSDDQLIKSYEKYNRYSTKIMDNDNLIFNVAIEQSNTKNQDILNTKDNSIRNSLEAPLETTNTENYILFQENVNNDLNITNEEIESTSLNKIKCNNDKASTKKKSVKSPTLLNDQSFINNNDNNNIETSIKARLRKREKVKTTTKVPDKIQPGRKSTNTNYKKIKVISNEPFTREQPSSMVNLTRDSENIAILTPTINNQTDEKTHNTLNYNLLLSNIVNAESQTVSDKSQSASKMSKIIVCKNDNQIVPTDNINIISNKNILIATPPNETNKKQIETNKIVESSNTGNTSTISGIEQVEKRTPTNNQGKQLKKCSSTPRRNSSHIRVLDFTTPYKFDEILYQQNQIQQKSNNKNLHSVKTPRTIERSINLHMSRITSVDDGDDDDALNEIITATPLTSIISQSSDGTPSLSAKITNIINDLDITSTPKLDDCWNKIQGFDTIICDNNNKVNNSDKIITITPNIKKKTIKRQISTSAKIDQDEEELISKPVKDTHLIEWNQMRSATKINSNNWDDYIRSIVQSRENEIKKSHKKKKVLTKFIEGDKNKISANKMTKNIIASDGNDEVIIDKFVNKNAGQLFRVTPSKKNEVILRKVKIKNVRKWPSSAKKDSINDDYSNKQVNANKEIIDGGTTQTEKSSSNTSEIEKKNNLNLINNNIMNCNSNQKSQNKSQHITTEPTEPDIQKNKQIICETVYNLPIIDFGNVSLFETPYKYDQTGNPITPRFMMDHPSSLISTETPTTKAVNSLKEYVTLVKNSDIMTPLLPITPGNLLAQTPKILSPFGSSVFQNRPTDYSSSSSYYRPDESEEIHDLRTINKINEQEIILGNKNNNKTTIKDIITTETTTINNDDSGKLFIDHENVVDDKINENIKSIASTSNYLGITKTKSSSSIASPSSCSETSSSSASSSSDSELDDDDDEEEDDNNSDNDNGNIVLAKKSNVTSTSSSDKSKPTQLSNVKTSSYMTAAQQKLHAELESKRLRTVGNIKSYHDKSVRAKIPNQNCFEKVKNDISLVCKRTSQENPIIRKKLDSIILKKIKLSTGNTTTTRTASLAQKSCNVKVSHPKSTINKKRSNNLLSKSVVKRFTRNTNPTTTNLSTKNTITQEKSKATLSLQQEQSSSSKRKSLTPKKILIIENVEPTKTKQQKYEKQTEINDNACDAFEGNNDKEELFPRLFMSDDEEIKVKNSNLSVINEHISHNSSPIQLHVDESDESRSRNEEITIIENCKITSQLSSSPKIKEMEKLNDEIKNVDNSNVNDEKTIQKYPKTRFSSKVLPLIILPKEGKKIETTKDNFDKLNLEKKIIIAKSWNANKDKAESDNSDDDDDSDDSNDSRMDHCNITTFDEDNEKYNKKIISTKLSSPQKNLSANNKEPISFLENNMNVFLNNRKITLSVSEPIEIYEYYKSSIIEKNEFQITNKKISNRRKTITLETSPTYDTSPNDNNCKTKLLKTQSKTSERSSSSSAFTLRHQKINKNENNKKTQNITNVKDVASTSRQAMLSASSLSKALTQKPTPARRSSRDNIKKTEKNDVKIKIKIEMEKEKEKERRRNEIINKARETQVKLPVKLQMKNNIETTTATIKSFCIDDVLTRLHGK